MKLAFAYGITEWVVGNWLSERLIGSTREFGIFVEMCV